MIRLSWANCGDLSKIPKYLRIIIWLKVCLDCEKTKLIFIMEAILENALIAILWVIGPIKELIRYKCLWTISKRYSAERLTGCHLLSFRAGSRFLCERFLCETTINDNSQACFAEYADRARGDGSSPAKKTHHYMMYKPSDRATICCGFGHEMMCFLVLQWECGETYYSVIFRVFFRFARVCSLASSNNKSAICSNWLCKTAFSDLWWSKSKGEGIFILRSNMEKVSRRLRQVSLLYVK